jgi:hypothetical protein
MTAAVTIRPTIAMTAFRTMATFPLRSCGQGIMPVSDRSARSGQARLGRAGPGRALIGTSRRGAGGARPELADLRVGVLQELVGALELGLGAVGAQSLSLERGKQVHELTIVERVLHDTVPFRPAD